MTKLEKIEQDYHALSPEERRAFLDMVFVSEDDEWDRQMRADSAAGKFDKLAEKALGEHRAGKTTPL